MEHNYHEAWIMGRERQKDLLLEGEKRRRAASAAAPSGRPRLRVRVGSLLITLGLKLAGTEEESGGSDQ